MVAPVQPRGGEQNRQQPVGRVPRAWAIGDSGLKGRLWVGMEYFTMDHVREIQEIVDEHKEQLPTGVVTGVMEQCQKAYNAMPNLWKIHYVEIDAAAKNRACLDTKVAIFEETHSQIHHWQGVFARQKMPKAELQKNLIGPAFHDGGGRVLVVTYFERWGKRAREE